VPRWALLLEGWGDEPPFMARARGQFEPQAMQAISAVGAIDLDIYRHQITHTGAACPARSAQAWRPMYAGRQAVARLTRADPCWA